MNYGDTENIVKQLQLEASQLQARAEKAEQKCAELAAALKTIMVGGNHLASALVSKLGAGDATFPPYKSSHEDARLIIKDPNGFDSWVCWKTIMLVRDTLEQKVSAILATYRAKVERETLATIGSLLGLKLCSCWEEIQQRFALKGETDERD